MGEYKKSSLVFAILLVGILLASSINLASAITLVTPATSGTVSGAKYNLNASIGTLTNMTTCSFYAKSSSTANSTWGILGTIANVSSNAYSLNISFPSAGLEDASTYIFNATCQNETALQDSTSTSVIVDNTTPTAPSSLSPATNTKDTDGSVTFSATVVGAETTSCSLKFFGTNPGNPSYTMTHTGNTCTHTLSAMPEQSYQFYIDATDGKDTTSSTKNTVNVDGSSSAGKTVALAQQSGVKSIGGAELSVSNTTYGIPNWTWFVIGAIVLIVLIVIFKRK